MLGIGVVGYGYWGPNLVRNFSEVSTGFVAAVSDMRQEKLDLVHKRHPHVHTYLRYEDMLKDPEVGAVAVATPVATHFALAMEALDAGKHVFIEKPISSTSQEAAELIEAAKKCGRVLMVDHTFLYTGAVRKIREIIDSGELGDLYQYDSTRINLGLFRPDVNVVWDLAVHDLSIMDYLLGQSPVAVSATGISHLPGQRENTAYLTLFFDSSTSSGQRNALIGHVNVSWMAPAKVRQTLITGSRKMVVFDDLEPDVKVKVFDKGIILTPENEYTVRVGYRTGDMWAPQLDMTEALNREARHFIECVEEGKTPLSDGNAGLRVVRILEAASRSIEMRGTPVELQ